MRQVMVDRADQRRLPVAVPGPPDPRPRRRSRRRPSQPASIRPRRVVPSDRVTLIPDASAVCAVTVTPGTCVDPRRRRYRRQKRRVEMPVLDHMAHRAFFDLGGEEIEKQRRRAFARPSVAGPDPQDRLRCGCQRGPDADGLQQPPRRDGQRIGPPVEGGLGPRPRRLRVDQRDAQARLRQRQCQRWPVQPAADDQRCPTVCP